MNRSTLLRRILLERRAVPVPGCHDALSAKVIESCDFEALQKEKNYETRKLPDAAL